MLRTIRRLSALFLVSAMITVFAGCAATRPGQVVQRDPSSEKGETPQEGWWYARFLIKWPQGIDPSWHVDVLLAHQVISPVLEQYKDHIGLWRFHRRAARDKTGHQFSFIFYSSPATARQVYGSLQSNALLKEMKTAGLIVKDSYDDTNPISRPNMEDTSDPNWSEPIQKSWPFYIMGVSAMWLHLIEEVAAQTSVGKPPSSTSTSEMLAFYRKVSESIKTLWQKEGQHALLHHLNALFGYEPLVVYEKRLIGF